MKITFLIVILILLITQWLALLGYFRVTFNRSLTPLVWRQGVSGGIKLIPSRFRVSHSSSKHIIRSLISAGYTDLYLFDKDVELFSVTPTSSAHKDTCILMADGRPFHDPLKDTIPDIMRIDEAQHAWSVDYVELTPYMNLLYALRHGYSFWRFTLPKELIDGGQRDSTWYKIPLTSYMLQYECHVVFWLDSDAFIRDFAVTLEELGRAYDIHEGGPYMLLPQDGPGHMNANMGAFLIRNGSKALSFLKEWWNLPLLDEAFQPKLRGKLHEQDTLNHGMRTYKGSIWVLCPKTLLTTTSGSFVRHFWAGHKNETLFRMEMARLAMEFVQYLLQSNIQE